MIIDSHTHLFPDHMRQDRSLFFENEPEFKLLYNTSRSPMAGLHDLIQTMDEDQVDIAVISGFPWRDPEKIKEHNDFIIESALKYPDRIKGLACFDTTWRGAADETARCINAGLSGVGELAFYLSGIDSDALSALSPVMSLLKERGNLPCMIHTNEPIGHKYPGKTPVTLEQISALVSRFPDNRIILAHWGGGIFFYHVMKKQLKQDLKNVWYDTAASIFLYDSSIYNMAVSAGVIDKVLFGTDYPLIRPARYYTDIDQSGLAKEHKKLVLGDNAGILYNKTRLS